MSNTTLTAITLALKAHAGQFRRDGVTPYVAHPIATAILAAARGGHSEAIETALLHDAIEDGGTTEFHLRASGLSKNVIDAVLALTKNHSESYKDYILRVRANPIAAFVKRCDIAANMSDDPTPKQRAKYVVALSILNEMEDL